MDLKPKAITAALIGLKSKLATFRLQRVINEYTHEPLSAILPGAALQELWGLVATAETALKAVSAMVVATALLGMVTMILTTLNERRREMAILRSVGARPRTVLGLLMAEAGVLTLVGVGWGSSSFTPPYWCCSLTSTRPMVCVSPSSCQSQGSGHARDNCGCRLHCGLCRHSEPIAFRWPTA